MPVALVTGGSAGLGRALVHTLGARGWTVVTDGRDHARLAAAVGTLPAVVPVVGDVADPAHVEALAREVGWLGRLDLLVHNASTLGPLPLRPLRETSTEELLDVWRVNAAAPVALTRAVLPQLRTASGVVVSLSSDAAVEHYETWGAYAAGKAALDHLTLTLAAEEDLTAYAVDPGDMRTAMHQDAFPGEDISDRPLPETVVPQLLALLAARPPSGRYRAASFAQVPA
ncbi:SDR family oxidoreductase [Nocardioides dongxiaopingii]|uniref:SDR family NAD(P)-dependent oxidoreductase n=1 Tax=Nocardioides sp. S-1144 TaxID=2582905 RepID=UPI00110ED730|nr:SDR family oxidoreductase [Nocardioides sp. S-1144]QCW50653.1 SDR family oxidoreductase [Nocardioides sp. S-1144]